MSCSSLYEDSLFETLEVAVEVLPVKDLIEILVPKILARCMKLLQKADSPDLNLAGRIPSPSCDLESGCW